LRHDEAIVAGAPIRCGATLLVPLLRVRAHAFTAWAGMAEADVVAFVSCAGSGATRIVPLDDTVPAANDWSAWLAAHPALLADVRARLGTRAPATRAG
jgi:hypothetical protein